MPHLAIIIPCYNEADRLDKSKYLCFINQWAEANFYFVNDGSKDDTIKILTEIRNLAPTQTNIIELSKNVGKGEAIRTGINAALRESSYDFIGYLDADLSTSLTEFQRIYQYGLQKKADLILASRIKKVDTVIERSFIRHIIGRTIATLIDQRFDLGIYDTQCGAKIINTTILQKLIEKKFYTKWFFDVELFIRMRREFEYINAVEIPLTKWKSVKGSNLNILSFPTVLKELFILFTKY